MPERELLLVVYVLQRFPTLFSAKLKYEQMLFFFRAFTQIKKVFSVTRKQSRFMNTKKLKLTYIFNWKTNLLEILVK